METIGNKIKKEYLEDKEFYLRCLLFMAKVSFKFKDCEHDEEFKMVERVFIEGLKEDLKVLTQNYERNRK